MTTTAKVLPRYPVYVPSKGRFDLGAERDDPTKTHFKWVTQCLTADGVPHFLVVEEQEVDDYRRSFPEAEILVLDRSGAGLLYARNWIRTHAEEAGHARHWQIDDNIACFKRRYKGRRVPCRAGIALRACEDFVDRYENVGVAGLQYEMFVPNGAKMPPFYLNTKVYSCSLINHAMPCRWRLAYNDDTDICLQALAAGWCTITLNAFMVWKCRTMLRGGGNTSDLYQGDGRTKMSRSLERVWPYVVETKRRFQRPQHVVRDAWGKFDVPLRRRTDIDWDAIEASSNDYGMRLTKIGPTKNRELEELFEEDARGDHEEEAAASGEGGGEGPEAPREGDGKPERVRRDARRRRGASRSRR